MTTCSPMKKPNPWFGFLMALLRALSRPGSRGAWAVSQLAKAATQTVDHQQAATVALPMPASSLMASSACRLPTSPTTGPVPPPRHR